MAVKRYRKGLYKEKAFPFPTRLMSTARASQSLSTDYAQYLENMLPSLNNEGVGQKRFGTTKLNDEAIPGAPNIEEILYYRRTDGTVQELLYTDDGSIYIFQDGGAYSDGFSLGYQVGSYYVLQTGMDTTGTVRAVQQGETLIIANGKDPLLQYDGLDVTQINQWVRDTANAPGCSSTSTITLNTGFGNTNYPNGRRVRVTLDDGTQNIANVASSTYNQSTLTLTVALNGEVVPSGCTIDYVEFEVPAPALSDIYLFNDYLFGLSPGELHPTKYRGTEGLRLFHTTLPNNPASWVNDVTLSYAYTNGADKHNTHDEFLRIASLDGLLVLLGRERIQLWQGTDPNTIGSFSWKKTITTGCLHGSLVQEYPRDVLFFTPYGGRSLSRVLQTEQLDISSDLGRDIDPTITRQAKALLADAAVYKKAYSFLYGRDGFYGFKITGNPLIYNLGGHAKGWVEFSGMFRNARVVRQTPDGRLRMAYGGDVYGYANGSDDAAGELFSDDGQAYRAAWWTPWTRARRRWTNRYWQFLLESSGENVELSITRYTDGVENTGKTRTITLDTDMPQWGEAHWGESNWGRTDRQPLLRDKFLCDSFCALVETNDTKPIEILGIKAIGA